MHGRASASCMTRRLFTLLKLTFIGRGFGQPLLRGTDAPTSHLWLIRTARASQSNARQL